ncbi:MAG: hypothetical protein HY746_03475 [Elusimicrobia bacterium]|nr:hypothetical protein [Elusimicrobiota bacterium]
MNLSKFWIRKEREPYFLSGVIAASVIAGVVNTYWIFADRLAVKPKVEITKELSREKELKATKEVDLYYSKLKSGATSFYSAGDGSRPVVPKPSDE